MRWEGRRAGVGFVWRVETLRGDSGAAEVLAAARETLTLKIL